MFELTGLITIFFYCIKERNKENKNNQVKVRSEKVFLYPVGASTKISVSWTKPLIKYLLMAEGEKVVRERLTRSAFLQTMDLMAELVLQISILSFQCECSRIKLNIFRLYVTYLGFCGVYSSLLFLSLLGSHNTLVEGYTYYSDKTRINYCSFLRG